MQFSSQLSPRSPDAVESQYIQSSEQLLPFIDALQQKPVFAVDTEFVRERTLTAQFGLLQLYDGENLLLIEPDVALACDAIWQMLSNPQQRKVLHAANEDLELFWHVKGIRLENILDTQTAAAFLDMGNALGFGALVEQQLGVSLDKSHARTDWLKRPLTEQQLTYAADDVRYLLPTYELLLAQLDAKGLTELCLAESQRVASSKQLTDKSLAYLNVKNSWQLAPRQLALLQLLAEWRLELAEKKDLALSFVINDHALIAIAKSWPQSMTALKKIEELKPHELRRYATALLKLVEQASSLSESDYPQAIIRVIDLPGYKTKQKQLAKTVAEIAQQQGIPNSVLASKKQIGQYLLWQYKSELGQADAALPVLAQGWRSQLLMLD